MSKITNDGGLNTDRSGLTQAAMLLYLYANSWASLD